MNEHHAALCLSALGSPIRIRLFRLLVRAGTDGLNVGELQDMLDIPASTLSHHIAALATADLLVRNRQGREVICVANYAVMNRVLAYLTEHCCTGVGVQLLGDGVADSAA
jgi:DNA-binding transcriptional ArsR family regulator